MSVHDNIADERFRPALDDAGCKQWLVDCVEASEDGWQHNGRVTHMCVIFAPVHCDGLFARRGKGESAILLPTGGTPTVEDVASFEVKSWQLVMLLGIGWLLLRALHRIVWQPVGQEDRGPLRTPSTTVPLCRLSQGDPRPVPPPPMTSRPETDSPEAGDVEVTPRNGISLQLGGDECLQESSMMARSTDKWSFDTLASGNDNTAAEIIAGGSFAQVGRTHLANGTHVAVKEMATWHPSLESHTEDFIQRELHMLQVCSVHPNVVDTLGWIKTSRRVLLMMPLAPTNVQAMIEVEPLKDNVARALVQQLVSALDFMHRRSMAHRDVKPANLLVATGEIFQPPWSRDRPHSFVAIPFFRDKDMTLLLADFGVADKVPGGGYFTDVVGTESYMAPEILNDNENTRQYSVLVDMWATGVVVNEMLTKTTPFRPGRTEAGAFTGLDLDAKERDNIRMGRGTFELALDGTTRMDFISQLLVVDPSNRLSATQAAEHTWLGGKKEAEAIRARTAKVVAEVMNRKREEKLRPVEGSRRIVRGRRPVKK